MIVFGPEHGERIARRAGIEFNPVADRCIARVERGELLGGAVYQGFNVASIGVHIAGFTPNWINPDMLWAGFTYPFSMLGCNKLIAQVPENNLRALEFNLKIGFKIETRVRDVFPDADLIVMGMYRGECRWLKIRPRGRIGVPEHGKQEFSTA